MMQSYSFKHTVKILIGVLIAGIVLRLYGLTADAFLFYDEGMYLGQNRSFLHLVAANPPKSMHEFAIILGLMFKAALMSPKSLWFFLLDLRVFMGGPEFWNYARFISAGAGLLTVGLAYAWGRRYYKSVLAGLLAASILCVLPSHVFYSRLAMQESLCALLFLSGMYLYVFSPRGPSVMSCAAAFVLAAMFFTNYRMIIAPLFPALAAFILSQSRREPFDMRKLVWFVVVFSAVIFGLGALYGGANTYVTFGWMFHQADESAAFRHWINFLSFPYYIFALEGVVFAVLLWWNAADIWQRRWAVLVPFACVLAQIFLFSFAAEKGARYLCVVLPFAAIAVGGLLANLIEQGRLKGIGVPGVLILLFITLIWNTAHITRAQTDYAKAVRMVLRQDPNAKIISTQPLVESLFMNRPNDIVPLPKDPQSFAFLLSQGYRYLIIDPQVYVSWTADQRRFTEPLIAYVEMIRRQARPVAVLPHIDGILLKRFVLDHNQDLRDSLDFLRNPEGKGRMYIYDLNP